MYFIRRLQIIRGLGLPVILLSAEIVLGIIGFMIVEQYGFIDALYMTIITVGSVGFTEVHPMTVPGRIFTTFLILVNIGLFSYFVTLLTRYFLDVNIIKDYKKFKMEINISKLKDHVIICGFGRNGRESAQVLHNHDIPFVVIEEKNELPEDLDFKVPFFIKGDATKDEVLEQAGIMQARAIITTLPIDPDNLFVVLTAKQLNAQVKVISRASSDSSVSKLKIAGARNVIMPDKLGGAHMATLVMLPDVAEMLSLMTTRNSSEFRVVEIKSQKDISLYELDLWRRTNCSILGVKEDKKNYTLNPPTAYVLKPGQRVIIMGSEAQIEDARKLLTV